MKNTVKEKGRQVSFLNKEQTKTSCLDLMKEKVDSVVGRKMYSRRIWTIELVFGNILSNKRLDRISLRDEKNVKLNGLCSAWCIICKSSGRMPVSEIDR
jgi:hypothetical protein